MIARWVGFTAGRAIEASHIVAIGDLTGGRGRAILARDSRRAADPRHRARSVHLPRNAGAFAVLSVVSGMPLALLLLD